MVEAFTFSDAVLGIWSGRTYERCQVGQDALIRIEHVASGRALPTRTGDTFREEIGLARLRRGDEDRAARRHARLATDLSQGPWTRIVK